MVELEFLDYAQEMAVVVDFLRSYLNANSQRESFISGCHSRTIRGSWSRGYDATLTWWRSQVQFLPSPPMTSYDKLHNKIIF